VEGGEEESRLRHHRNIPNIFVLTTNNNKQKQMGVNSELGCSSIQANLTQSNYSRFSMSPSSPMLSSPKFRKASAVMMVSRNSPALEHIKEEEEGHPSNSNLL